MEIANGADSVAPSARGQAFSAARDHDRCGAYPKVCWSVACLDASTPVNSVFLKNETGDPSQLCISAAVGLLMPTCLWGMDSIGAEVWPLASVVDQFWIRSDIHSHGSTPDRKSRAVPSS